MSCAPYSPYPSDSSEVIETQKSGHGWYSDDPSHLREEIEEMLKNVEINVEQNIVSERRPLAVIVPHAGYRYSGKTAAYAFKEIQIEALRQSYSRVIIIGPSHYYGGEKVQNRLLLPSLSTKFYRTPLGDIPIDETARDFLLESSCFTGNNAPFLREHSIDNEIPFLQVALKSAFKIVPLMVGHLDDDAMVEVSLRIRALLTDETLVVVSSDFTHYGESFNYLPFTENVQKKLAILDHRAAEILTQKSVSAWSDFIHESRATICGSKPIALLLHLLGGHEKVQGRLLHYETSGEITGDFSHSVSYLSYLFEFDKFDKKESWGKLSQEIGYAEKKALLNWAWDTLKNHFSCSTTGSSTHSSIRRPYMGVGGALHHPMGGFVTLKQKKDKGGELRGCIGEIFPERSPVEVVEERVIDAAIHDSRFPPVTAEELKNIDIEITLLTPPQKIHSWREIEIGKHGIYLIKGQHRAVFLPQVAIEQNWDLETTLTHLAYKAGLHPSEWQEGCEFSVFEGILIS